jgi:hypothetical protein
MSAQWRHGFCTKTSNGEDGKLVPLEAPGRGIESWLVQNSFCQGFGFLV